MTSFLVEDKSSQTIMSTTKQRPFLPIGLHQKDLNLALLGARALGVFLPNTATAHELFNACAAQGGAKWDHSAMVKALEPMAQHPVA